MHLIAAQLSAGTDFGENGAIIMQRLSSIVQKHPDDARLSSSIAPHEPSRASGGRSMMHTTTKSKI